MSKNILILGAVVIVILGGILFLSGNNNEGTTQTQETATIEQATLERYKEYSPELVSNAAPDQKTVLFFHASWCPTCQVADRAFKESHDEIPADVVILKTDYDTSDDLKRQYDVNYQHTFVQVESDGSQVTQWNGGDLSQVKARVQ